jgi:hypothetical protein
MMITNDTDVLVLLLHYCSMLYTITLSEVTLDEWWCSHATKGHIYRAFYGTYLQVHCLNDPKLDVREFGFL